MRADVFGLRELRPSGKLLLLCYGLAVAIRLYFIAVFPGTNYFGGVSARCLDVGKNVVEGRGYVFYVNVAPFGSPDKFEYVPFIDKPIGYPTFLAGVFFLFGQHPIAVQVVQAFLLALGCIVVFKLLKLFNVSDRLALGGAFLTALWPNHARFEVTILPEAVMPFLLILTAYLLTKAFILARDENRRNSKLVLQLGLAAGLALGFGVLSRPDVMFLPIWLGVLCSFLLSWKHTVRVVLPMSVVFYGIIGLHTIRNYALTGEVIPLGYSNGTVLWQGISQFGDTLGTVYSDYRIAHHEGYPSILYPNGIARDRKRFNEAVSIIKEHPIFFLSLIPRRVPLLLVPRGLLVQDDPAPSTSDTGDFPQKVRAGLLREIATSPGRASVKIFSALSGVLLLLFAFYGYWKTRKAHPELAVGGLMVVYFAAVLLPINAEARYFFPAVILLFPLAILSFKRKSI